MTKTTKEQPRSILLPSLAIAALFAGCGGEPTPSVGSRPSGDELVVKAAVPNDMAKLVPADMPVLVYIAEPDKLLDEVRSLAKKMNPGSEHMVDLDVALSQTPLDVRARDLDLAQPMAVLLNENGPTQMIVAAQDPADLADADTPVSGKHLAIAMPIPGAPKPAVGAPSPLVKDLPAAAVTVRVDLGAFREQIGQGEQMFRQLLAQEPGGEAVFSVYAPLFEMAKEGGVVDLLFDIEDGMLSLAAVAEIAGEPATAPAGAPSVVELLARVPSVGDGAMVMVLGPVMKEMAEWFDIEEMMGVLFAEAPNEVPAEFQRVMREYGRAVKEAYSTMDGPMASSFAFGDGGMKGAFAMSVSDSDGAIEAVSRMMRSLGEFGFINEVDQRQVEVQGAQFDYVEAGWDFESMAEKLALQGPAGGPEPQALIEAMYGERVRGALGKVGDLLVSTVGMPAEELDTVVSVAKDGGQTHGDASAALAAVPGQETVAFLYMDIFALMRPLMRIIQEMPGARPAPKLPDGKAPLLFSIGRTGTQYRADLRFDLEAFAELGR